MTGARWRGAEAAARHEGSKYVREKKQICNILPDKDMPDDSMEDDALVSACSHEFDHTNI